MQPDPTADTDRSAPSERTFQPPPSQSRESNPHARSLADALRRNDPLRSGFDVAVRHFVRVERAEGRSLDTILTQLRAILRSVVEPHLAPAQRSALRHAASWFAVSEYHRAD